MQSAFSYLMSIFLAFFAFGRAEKVTYYEAISGEPTIAQVYELAGTGATGPNGETLRANDEVDPVDGLTYFAGQPYHDGKKTLQGRKRRPDEFFIQTFISGKPAIVARHVGDDDVINWNAVAGENDNVHDHWVDYFGDVEIKGFKLADGDTLVVRGHTVALNSISYSRRDTFIVVQSQQGDGGGAHDEDILGTIRIKGQLVPEQAIEFQHANDGIAETYDEFLNLVEQYEENAQRLRPGETTYHRHANKTRYWFW